MRGDLGFSEVLNVPVSEAIVTLLPASIELAIYSFIFALAVGVFLGTKSAVRKDTWVDHITRFVALSGFSIPLFWFALLLLYLFYSVLGWVGPGRLSMEIIMTYLPPYGNFKHFTGLLTIDSIINLNLPVFLDAVKHLILPVLVQVYIMQFVAIMSGVVLTESVFNWPGLGRLAATAAMSLDHATILGFALFMGILFIVSNLIVDTLYSYLDPRIRME
jgi:peptide/nickel transport system permease protein